MHILKHNLPGRTGEFPDEKEQMLWKRGPTLGEPIEVGGVGGVGGAEGGGEEEAGVDAADWLAQISQVQHVRLLVLLLVQLFAPADPEAVGVEGVLAV